MSALLLGPDGSDFTGFFSHAGVSSLDSNILNSDEDYYAVYHSVYDSFSWFSKYADPSFEYTAAMARFVGGIAMYFSSEPVLSFDPRDYGRQLVVSSEILQNTLFVFGGSVAAPNDVVCNGPSLGYVFARAQVLALVFALVLYLRPCCACAVLAVVLALVLAVVLALC